MSDDPSQLFSYTAPSVNDLASLNPTSTSSSSSTDLNNIDPSALSKLTMPTMDEDAKMVQETECGDNCRCVRDLYVHFPDEYNLVKQQIQELSEDSDVKKVAARSLPVAKKTGGVALSTKSIGNSRSSTTTTTTTTATATTSTSTISNSTINVNAKDKKDAKTILIATKYRGLGFCIKGILKLVDKSRNWMYKPTKNYLKGRAIHIDPEDEIENGDNDSDGDTNMSGLQEQTKITEEDDLKTTHCCNNCCLQGMSWIFVNGIQRLWKTTGNGTQKRRRSAVVQMMWNDVQGLPSGVCNEAIHAVLGASKNLIKTMRSKLLIAKTTDILLNELHGMAEYRKENGPINKQLTEAVQAVVEDMVLELFRVDPVTGDYYAMSSHKCKIPDLLNEMIDRMDDDWNSFCESTMRRALENFRKKYDVKLFGMTINHQFCPNCKLLAMVQQMLQLAVTKLNQLRRQMTRHSSFSWWSPSKSVPIIILEQPFASAAVSGECELINASFELNQHERIVTDGWVAVYARNCVESTEVERLMAPFALNSLWTDAPEYSTLPIMSFVGMIQVIECYARTEDDNEKEWVHTLPDVATDTEIDSTENVPRFLWTVGDSRSGVTQTVPGLPVLLTTLDNASDEMNGVHSNIASRSCDRQETLWLHALDTAFGGRIPTDVGGGESDEEVEKLPDVTVITPASQDNPRRSTRIQERQEQEQLQEQEQSKQQNTGSSSSSSSGGGDDKETSPSPLPPPPPPPPPPVLHPQTIADVDYKIRAIVKEIIQIEMQQIKHSENDIHHRRSIHSLQDMGERMADRIEKEAVMTGMPIESLPFKSQSSVYLTHVDDSAALQVPQIPMAVGSYLQKLNYSLNGQYDFVQKCINCFLSEGGIKKDSDAVFEEILLNLIYNLNGEQGLVMCFDCAPNNYCSLLTAAMLLLFVELGLVEFAVALFFWQYHGKSMSDRIFGVLRGLMADKAIFSVMDIALIVEMIKNKTNCKHSKAFIYQAATRMKWGVTLKKLYDIPYSTKFHFKDTNMHYFGCGVVTVEMIDTACQELTTALRPAHATLVPLMIRDIEDELLNITLYSERLAVRTQYEEDMKEAFEAIDSGYELEPGDSAAAVLISKLWRRLSILYSFFPLVCNVNEPGLLRMRQRRDVEKKDAKDITLNMHRNEAVYIPPPSRIVPATKTKDSNTSTTNETNATSSSSSSSSNTNEIRSTLNDDEYNIYTAILTAREIEVQAAIDAINAADTTNATNATTTNATNATNATNTSSSSSSSTTTTTTVLPSTASNTSNASNAINSSAPLSASVHSPSTPTLPLPLSITVPVSSDEIELLKKRKAMVNNKSIAAKNRTYNTSSIKELGYNCSKIIRRPDVSSELVMRSLEANAFLPWPSDYHGESNQVLPANILLLETSSGKQQYPSAAFHNDDHDRPTGYRNPEFMYASNGSILPSLPINLKSSASPLIARWNNMNQDPSKHTNISELINFLTKECKELEDITKIASILSKEQLIKRNQQLKEWDADHKISKEKNNSVAPFGLREEDYSIDSILVTLKTLGLMTVELKAVVENEKKNQMKRKRKKKKPPSKNMNDPNVSEQLNKDDSINKKQKISKKKKIQKKTTKKRSRTSSSNVIGARSAYKYFMVATRESVRSEYNNENTVPITATDLRTKLGILWKGMSDVDRIPYTIQQKADKLRYKQEMEIEKQQRHAIQTEREQTVGTLTNGASNGASNGAFNGAFNGASNGVVSSSSSSSSSEPDRKRSRPQPGQEEEEEETETKPEVFSYL